jgi:uncharacterized phage protein gp47/JayE
VDDWGVTASGFRRPSYTEMLDAVEQKAKELFGSNINLSVRSILGILLRIIAWVASLIWQLAEDVYNAGYVDSASGTSLLRLGATPGIRPLSARKSVGEVTVTGTPGQTVPAGLLAAATNKRRFVVLTATPIGAGGVVTCSAQAYETGPDGNVAAGTITTIVTPITGITGVTNAAAFSGGRLRETEAEFRARYHRTVAQANSSNEDAIRDALLDVTGVRQAIVYINNKHVEVDGVPANTVRAIVQGGADLDVAQVIYRKKAGGIDTFGATSTSVIDASGRARIISFDRPDAVNVWVRITDLQIKSGYVLTDVQAALCSAILAHILSLAVGQTVTYLQMTSAVSAVLGVDDLALAMSGDGVAWSTANIAVGVIQLAASDVGKVVFA